MTKNFDKKFIKEMKICTTCGLIIKDYATLIIHSNKHNEVRRSGKRLLYQYN